MGCGCDETRETQTNVLKAGYITGTHTVNGHEVPAIATRLGNSDKWGAFRMRFDIGRSNYRVEPGLYAIGTPDSTSPVLVTANYKLSFDSVRSEMQDLSAWLLVLDTKGINVWCAAGKGTFGTGELVNRIKKTGLADIVTHRNIVLPQLGGPGVAAHTVTKATGFKIVYGPVRAADIPAFLGSGMTKTTAMSEVTFDIGGRLTIAGVELAHSWPVLLIALAIMALVNIGSLVKGHPSAFLLGTLVSFLPYFAAVIAGTAVFPALMPWLPSRYFSIKGGILGFIVALCSAILLKATLVGWFILFLSIVPIVSFISLNFTGSTPFTSLSGVKIEMRRSIPVILISFSLSIILMAGKILVPLIFGRTL